MRFTSGLAAFATLLACQTHLVSATAAFVLTFEPETAHTKHKIALTGLSPSTARVVLAQRAGLEDYHTTQGLSEEEIIAVNTYGLRTKLFDGEGSRRRAFLLAELDTEAESNPKLRLQSRFTISQPPSFAATEELFQDLYTQAYPKSSNTDLRAARILEQSTSPIFHIAHDAATLVEMARKLAADKVTVTALLISGGHEGASWGTYEMPNTKPLLKRQSPHRVDPEEPLSAAFANSVPFAPSLNVLANSSNSSSNYTNTKPLSGILPACFTSESACESNTRGCTGHGSCKLKYKDQSTKTDEKTDKKPKECWACSCETTQSKGLTTYWAGSACQKKDISVEFWLLAGFTIGLLALVSFAIGTIWSMGESDLPSVLSAGVNGPTAKK